VVAKPTKRPTKRKLEPTSDKVMPTGGPREAVKRISRDEPASGSVEAVAAADLDEAEGLTGTRARKAAQAEKAAAAKPSRRRSKRVTEKGTGALAPAASGRYTPPSANYSDLPSPLWVPVLMFTMFLLGMLTIFLNYVELVPGGTSNWYLLLGLGFILAGIITATQYR
jgi:hypothetical protein